MYYFHEYLTSRYNWQLFNYCLDGNEALKCQILELYHNHEDKANNYLLEITHSKQKLIDCICNLGFLYRKSVTPVINILIQSERDSTLTNLVNNMKKHTMSAQINTAYNDAKQAQEDIINENKFIKEIIVKLTELNILNS